MQNYFEEKKLKDKNNPNFFIEIIKTLVIAFIIVIPIRIFIAQPFIVSGLSMDPAFKNGDYLIVDELSYRLSDPERLDVVIFRYPKQPSKFFIKRIIGLPGETVKIEDGNVTIITIEGMSILLDEPYVEFTKQDRYQRTLEEAEYFVLGDNRAGSSDSRIWGPLTENFIIGKPIVRLFPITHFDFKPGSVLEPREQ